MRPLRFAMVTTFYPPYSFGGDGLGVLRLSRALAARGHDVTVIHDADAYDLLRNQEAPWPAPSGGDDGVDVVTLRSGAPALSCLLTQQTGRPVVHGAEIRRLLDAGGYDVINYHNVSLVGGPGVLAAGDAVKLYMAHEHWLVCPTHVLWRHGRELCTARECVKCQLTHRRPPQLWRDTQWFERQLDHVDAFIALSEFSRAKHLEFGFPRDMTVVPHFLAAAPPHAAAADAPPHQRPYFLFVGRLERIKGLDDVIPLFSGTDGADLLIAGDGDYAPTLRALGAAHPRVRFLGAVEPEQLRRYYRHALALVVPSVCFETFGLIIIEAFREGTPVLARRIGPFPEMIEAGGGGELFATGAELVTAMRRLETEPERRAQLSREGLAAFAANWSEDAVMPRYLDVARRAAAHKGGAHQRVAAALGAGG
jgi:glycosyltransferase involved in cell wall biosynthesis